MQDCRDIIVCAQRLPGSRHRGEAACTDTRGDEEARRSVPCDHGWATFHNACDTVDLMEDAPYSVSDDRQYPNDQVLGRARLRVDGDYQGGRTQVWEVAGRGILPDDTVAVPRQVVFALDIETMGERRGMSWTDEKLPILFRLRVFLLLFLSFQTRLLANGFNDVCDENDVRGDYGCDGSIYGVAWRVYENYIAQVISIDTHRPIGSP